jgi:hypothetical protein
VLEAAGGASDVDAPVIDLTDAALSGQAREDIPASS